MELDKPLRKKTEARVREKSSEKQRKTSEEVFSALQVSEMDLEIEAKDSKQDTQMLDVRYQTAAGYFHTFVKPVKKTINSTHSIFVSKKRKKTLLSCEKEIFRQLQKLRQV